MSNVSIANVKGNDTVTFDAGDNIAITQTGRGLSVALARDISVNSVTTKDLTATGNVTLGGGAGTSVKIANATTVDMGGNRIQNVGNATADTDAVNKAYVDNALRNSGATPGLSNRVNQLARDLNKVDKKARGGIAGAVATAGIPQVYMPGKSMIAAAAGSYRGTNAIAVGYSRASDNGKVVLKITGSSNTQGDYTGSVGLGYQW
ncbi:YadA-like C-terminal region [Stutzerimonas stutzeri]|nr:YadA-like C-terminal region [Stutzerimonas stutzeri]